MLIFRRHRPFPGLFFHCWSGLQKHDVFFEWSFPSPRQTINRVIASEPDWWIYIWHHPLFQEGRNTAEGWRRYVINLHVTCVCLPSCNLKFFALPPCNLKLFALTSTWLKIFCFNRDVTSFFQTFTLSWPKIFNFLRSQNLFFTL